MNKIKKRNTLTEQIILKNLCKDIRPEGEHFCVTPDLLLGHDAAVSLLIKDFQKIKGRIWDNKKTIFAADHFVPPASAERADILKGFLDFIREQGVDDSWLFKGICHQVLAEDSRALPYKVIVGADSHTVTAGAIGAFATGFGSTDMLYTLITGKTWLTIPEAIKIALRGRVPDYILGKDIILELVGRLGEQGAGSKALEFFDRTENKISMDSRFSICNMVVECGAKNGLFIPDALTRQYLDSRDGAGNKTGDIAVSEQAVYHKEITLNVSELEPKVALPSSPSNVVPASEISGEKVDQVFIGSCNGGRLEDLEAASRILKGKKIPSRLKLIIIPSSSAILTKAMEKGYIQTLLASGATLSNPSCGPCGGIDKGLLGRGESCISTSNRNFKGRMGARDGRVFLSSTLTAAASAVEAKIADPRNYL